MIVARQNTDNDEAVNPEVEQVIEEFATFIRSTETRKITEFQKRVNEAAKELCMKCPGRMKAKRGDLLALARKKVANEGYQFKKGKSRSKKYGQESGLLPSSPKRPKYDQAMRQQQIAELQESIEQTIRQITIKEKHIAQAEKTRNYRLCDELSTDIADLKRTRREQERELNLFQRKDK